MSKKANRRAARQAFPKAKPVAASRGRYAGGTRGRTSAPSRSRGQGVRSRGQANRSRAQGGSQTLRPPTIKKAVITGAVLAFAYFAVIQWAWKSGGTTEANALVSFLVFFLYAAVVYGVEWWKYRRKLRSMKGSSK
jgi:hypothetical protein